MVLRDGDRLYRHSIFQAKVQEGHPVPLEGSCYLVLRSGDRGVLRAQLDLSGYSETG